MWLNAALKKEEESWLNGGIPELIDQYYFSPLAINVIQVSTHLNCHEQDFTAQELVETCSRCNACVMMFLDD